jgi:hypothetical protein
MGKDNKVGGRKDVRNNQYGRIDSLLGSKYRENERPSST